MARPAGGERLSSRIILIGAAEVARQGWTPGGVPSSFAVMNDLRPTLDAPDDDPWLFLEEIDGSSALAWVETENRRTLDRFADERFRADRDALRATLDRPDNLPAITRRGGSLYNFWQDAAHPRGIWRRTTLDGYRADPTAWDILLDLDALAAAEGEDWVWHGAATLPPAHDRAMLSLSRGGSDAVVLREWDLGDGRFVADGFRLDESKSDVDWLDRDTLLLASAFDGGDHATRSGYARHVRRWARGTAAAEAPILFSVPADHLGAGAGLDRSTDGERVVFHDAIGMFDRTLHVGDRDGPRAALALPTDARLASAGDALAISLRTAWTVADTVHQPDTVLGLRLPDVLAGAPRPVTLWRAGARASLGSMMFVRDTLVLSVLDELRPRFLAFDAAEGWAAAPFPGPVPDTGVVSARPLDSFEHESDGTLLLTTQDPLTPPTVLLATVGAPAAPAVLRRAPAAFDADGLVVTRHEAIAPDGERIPYVQTGPAGAPTGDAPVHMTGYGGFNVTVLPRYGTIGGKLWLERGGTTVLANIRGGGEFGTSWHEAGRGAGKAVAHADFAAVADDLVRRGVTRPGRIAAEGGSNGGLLIANMLTRFPDRFGALFCTIPLTDMRRYTQLLAGASWIGEYGDPAQTEDWAHLGRISAYHAAPPGPGAPPILIATTRRDDRVHPGHARKFAAKLRANGHETWFYEPEAGGHGYGTDHAELAFFTSLGARFLRHAIGWEA